MTIYIVQPTVPQTGDVKECNISGLKLASQASIEVPELKGIISCIYIENRYVSEDLLAKSQPTAVSIYEKTPALEKPARRGFLRTSSTFHR